MATKMNLNITQIKTSACETTYNVDGIKLQLWIITGGTPALAFDDYSFTERYDSLKKWDNTQYRNGKYEHQKYENIQGPTFELLPNGLKDIQTFLDKYLTKRNLRLKRFNAIPIVGAIKEIKSKRLHDKENYCYCHCELYVRPNYIPHVSVSSEIFYGRIDDDMEFIPEPWRKLSNVMNKFGNQTNWEDLTETKFDEICQAIKDVL